MSTGPSGRIDRIEHHTVAPQRHGRIIQTLGMGNGQPTGPAQVVAQAVVQAMRCAGLLGQQG